MVDTPSRSVWNHGRLIVVVMERHPERPYLTSSTHKPHDVIETPVGPVGLLICWDLAFPEAFRELITAGAKIIIVPTFCMIPSPFRGIGPYPRRLLPLVSNGADWSIGTLTDCSEYGLSVNPRSEALFLESTITSRTFENTCTVVFVNAGGPVGSPNSNYAGLSRGE